MNFKPIEEPKREGRIDKVVQNLLDKWGALATLDVVYIREAIEKHMPRISNEEVNKAIDEGGDMPKYSIKLLLKSKGLLE